MRQRMGVLFPVLAVEGDDLHGLWLIIQAVYIDVHAIRIRSRHVKGFDPAGFTEIVFGYAAVKGIGGQVFLAGEQLEFACRDYQMQVARLGAY